MIKLRLGLALWVVMLAGSGQAAPVNILVHDLVTVASSPAWLKLLHYERQADRSYVSRVVEPGFFVSKSGRTEPLEELRALIAALRQPAQRVGSLQQSAACAFPARARLVRTMLGIAGSDVACPDFAQWRERLGARSVTLVFASAYANNPASLFGHTLLRLNSYPASAEPTLAARELLNYSVSFLAQTDPTDNVLAYTYKGLFGGYFGTYNIDPYYMSVAIYNDAEDRDLWEYDLELTAAAMTMLVEHVWELSHNARVTYFFATENCSFQIMALLEAVMPEMQLTDAVSGFVLPLDTVRTTIAAGLVPKRVRRRPALGTAMEQAVSGLSAADRLTFEALARADQTTLAGAPAIAAMDAAVAYWNYRKFAVAGKLTPAESAWLRTLLLKRASMGAGRDEGGLPRAETQPDDVPTRPDHGHATASVRTYAGRFGSSTYGGVAVRAGLHDLLSDARGYDGSAAITYGDLDVRAERRPAAKTRVELERLTIAEVVSLAPSTTLIPRWSWRLGGGARRAREYADQDGTPLTAGMDLAGGKAVAPFDGALLYLMAAVAPDAGPRLPRGFQVATGVDVGWLARYDSYRMLLEARWRRPIGPEQQPFTAVIWQHAVSLDVDHELRAEWHWLATARHAERGGQVSYVHHF